MPLAEMTESDPILTLTKTDAWVFMAIADDAGRPDLYHVVGSLDYLNRAMPTEREFSDSVNRLGQAGLITASDLAFEKTSRGRDVLESLPREGVIRVMLDLMKRWDGNHQPVVEPNFSFHLPPGAWDVAQLEAHERFLEWFERHKEQQANVENEHS